MDWTDLKDYVGASAQDDSFIQSCWSQAQAQVTALNRVWDSETETYVTSAAPADIVDRATLEVGSELYHRRNAPNGVAQFASYDGAPVRVARDPMVAARPLLAPWVVMGL